jgi:transcriptional regulator NrdR family protein
MPEGGTHMYCSYCEKITECAATPLTELKKPSNQKKKYKDINWFRRGRECLVCGETFITGELNESFIEELKILRDIKSFFERDNSMSLALKKIRLFLYPKVTKPKSNK